MSPLILIVSTLIFGAISFHDIKSRLIPDQLSVLLIILAIVRWTVPFRLELGLYALGAAVLVFGVGLALFAWGKLGGGDVKVTAATVFLVGAHDTPAFLLIMAFAGFFVSLTSLVVWWMQARKLKIAPSLLGVSTEDSIAPLTVPYGVAIALAGFITIIAQTLHQ